MNRYATQNSTTALVRCAPALGFALIFANLSLILINMIGALVFALLVPYIAIGRTLLYFDLQVQAQEEPMKRWRERLPRRATPASAGVQPAP